MLKTVNPKSTCPSCQGRCGKRNPCSDCDSSGFAPIDIQGMWSGAQAGFLVCGGPSLKTLDTRKLGMRGVVSLGVNNCAASVPVRSWTFSDPQYKFHHSLFLDGSVITFAPTPKLRRLIRVQRRDGSWTFVRRRVADCPSTIGYSRSAAFCPEEFLTSPFAQWGLGGHQHKKGEAYRKMMSGCSECGGSGVCSECGGNGKTASCFDDCDDDSPDIYSPEWDDGCEVDCDKCLSKHGKPTGKCAKCAGVGLVRPFTRQATMLVGLRLLCHMGITRIYCIGIDFHRPDKEQGYGFDESGSGGTGVYEKENLMLRMVQPHLSKAGIEVFNCSPDSRCTAFPYHPFDAAIEDCTRYTRNVRTRGWYAKGSIPELRRVPEAELPAIESLEV